MSELSKTKEMNRRAFFRLTGAALAALTAAGCVPVPPKPVEPTPPVTFNPEPIAEALKKIENTKSEIERFIPDKTYLDEAAKLSI